MNKKLVTAITAVALIFGVGACSLSESSEETKRKAAQKSATVADGVETQEVKNLKEKQRREENPNTVRYVYVSSFGKPMGYYMTKGKISSNGSQQGPELDLIDNCDSTCSGTAVDSKQDDGSYGDKDPGIFFFTTDGTMVVLVGYQTMQSDQPLAFDVPQLHK